MFLWHWSIFPSRTDLSPESHLLKQVTRGPWGLPMEPTLRRATDSTSIQQSEMVSLPVLIKHSVTAPLITQWVCFIFFRFLWDLCMTTTSICVRQQCFPLSQQCFFLSFYCCLEDRNKNKWDFTDSNLLHLLSPCSSPMVSLSVWENNFLALFLHERNTTS